MCQTDFSNIHLLPEENRALLHYSRLDRIPDGAAHLHVFLSLGFVARVGAVPDNTGVRRGGWYHVTVKGRRYLQYRKEKRDAEWREGRHFWITTIIAILALIIALLK